MAEEQNQVIEEQAIEPHGEEAAEIDWKAEARKWEKRAKENKEAAEKLTAIETDSASRISELEERAEKAEQEANDLRHKQDLVEWAKAAADAHGVPASILRGNTAEEFMEHAAEVKASNFYSVAPDYRDSGEPKQPPKSSKTVFNDFMNSTFN